MADVDAPRSLVSSGTRFLVAGGLNTLVTAAALAALSLLIDPRVAYALVFLAGIALSVVLADRFVFGVRMGRRAVAAYVAMYIGVFLLGLLVVDVIRRTAATDAAAALVVLVTAPLTFLGGRLITGRLHRSRTADPSRKS